MNHARRLDVIEQQIGVLAIPPADGERVRIYVPDDGRNPGSTILGDTGDVVIIYDPHSSPPWDNPATERKDQ